MLTKTGFSDHIIDNKSILEVVVKAALLQGISMRHLSLKICGSGALLMNRGLIGSGKPFEVPYFA